MRERFFREARSAATLRSPNICPVYDVGTIEGQLYLSMAYIEGRSLADELRSGRKFSLDEIALIIRKLAAALQKAHQLGIVHRDLKPGNVMLDADGEPVLMDFGLARRDQANDLRVTMSGVIVGSPAYMSPEQVDSDSDKVGPPSDIYSLGVVLYEMLTGRLPFQGSILSVIGQIANKTPPRPSEIRPELGGTPLEAICLKMMARQIDDRYGSMAEVATALDAIVSGGSMMMPLAAARGAAPVLKTTERPSRFGRWIVAVSAAALFLVLGSWAIYVVTDNGTLKIDSKVDDVKIEVTQNGKHVAFYDQKTDSEVVRLPSGDYQIKLQGDQNNVQIKPGKFTMTRGEVITIEATLLPPETTLPDKSVSAPAVEKSPDRLAAEWIVNVGATQRVSMDGITRHVAKADELPGGDFHVTEACLYPLQFQPNARLNKLAGLKELHWLRLFNCQVSDEAMKDLVDLPKLSFLDVAYNPVTDESFTHVASRLPHIKQLLAYYTRLTDKGLAELAKLPELDSVQLMNTSITDAGLAAFTRRFAPRTRRFQPQQYYRRRSCRDRQMAKARTSWIRRNFRHQCGVDAFGRAVRAATAVVEQHGSHRRRTGKTGRFYGTSRIDYPRNASERVGHRAAQVSTAASQDRVPPAGDGRKAPR